MKRSPALLGAAAGAALTAGALDAAPPAAVAPATLTAGEIGSRLRVFATPGDFELSNPAITAVVRRRDGWLTELWSNRGRLPTVRGLGATTDIDALWQFHPVVSDGKVDYPVRASRVVMLPDGIETEGVADTGVVRYRAVSTYRLDPDRPRLTIHTRFTVDGGSASAPVRLGDALKWGNVQYYVSGLRSPRMSYRGPATWIGRHGAGGDLLLRPVAPGRMWLDYRARIRGFQGTIHAFYHRGGIPKDAEITFDRTLAFEPLPVAPTRPPRDTGMLAMTVADEDGHPIPAKLRIDRAGVKRPIFDDDGGLDGADRFAWTANGRLARELPAGRYRVLVTAGIERDARRFAIRVRPRETVSLAATLPRVVDTPGWVSADLHLHQAPSVDADVSIPARIVSIAAEGVEFAVATDHYVITDLAPHVKWMRERGVLTVPLQTLPGCEVSTLGNRFGHFNVFPLAPGNDVVYQDTTVDELFADARRKSPGGILQVNHPRMDPAIAYWSYFGIDDATGEMARKGYNPSFDTVEVYNGDEARDLKLVRRVLLDWIHQLGLGHRYAATGSSDSHKLAFLDPGLPRTMVFAGSGDDGSDVAAPPKRILAAIKAGRSIVTSGPILDASVNGKGPGETATGLGPRATLQVRVRAAPWIDVTSVEVLVGPRARRVHWRQVRRSRSVVRFDGSFALKIGGPTFVVVTAQGTRGLPNASRDHTVPFGFTNPIWLEP